uniref:PRC-barrel domain-containing protein n=1 Tax=Thermofilum pendens TaxID=2269 RepID=A0A7C3SLV4_THEPE
MVFLRAVSVPRSELIGKNVYDQEAKLIGTVHDIALRLGEKEIALVVRTPGGTTIEVPWDKVAAVKDIVLLKEKVELPAEALVPAAPAAATPSAPTAPRISLPPIFKREKKLCPHCGQPATWIPQYQRWYCYNCQKYIE